MFVELMDIISQIKMLPVYYCMSQLLEHRDQLNFKFKFLLLENSFAYREECHI